MTTPPPRVDGRTARSERTRNAIVDAHVSLIGDGDLRPTADRIAKLAGVSLRALWSHFADMEALFAASGQRILERRDASFEPVPATIVQRSPISCTASSIMRRCSSSASVEASPVEPQTTSPSEPCSTRWFISRTVASSSTRSCASNGVTMAVRIVPRPAI